MRDLWGRNRAIEVLFILVIAIVTSIFYFHVIYRNGLTVGVDSPYYMIQVREIMRSGHMKYSDPPLIFYILTVPALFIQDIKLSFAYSVSVLMVLAALPFYFFMKRFLKSSFAASVSLLAILYSPTYIRMLGDFVKNQFGMMFVGLAMIYLFKEEKSHYDYLYIFLFTLLSGLTHILDLGIAILILISYLLYGLMKRDPDSIPLLLIITAVASIFIAGYYIWPFYFGDVGKFFSFLDSLNNPRRAAPARPVLRPNPLGNAMGRAPATAPNPFNPSSIPVAAILIGGFIPLIYAMRKGEFNKSRFLFSMVLLGILLILPWPGEWAFRFSLMTFLPTSLILGYFMSLIRDKIALVVLSLVILTYLVSGAIATASRLHPTISQAEYSDLTNMKRYVNGGAVVFRERYKGYWVRYILDVDVVHRVESVSGSYIILENRMNPPPHASLLYRGEVYSLYRI